MASALIAEKDADRDGPVPCPSSVHASPSGRRGVLDDRDLDVLLRRAGLAPDTSPGAHPGGHPGGNARGGPRGGTEDDGAAGAGGGRGSDGDCRVGQCRMPGVIQRLATVRSFTAMCCALAALTGASSKFPLRPESP